MYVGLYGIVCDPPLSILTSGEQIPSSAFASRAIGSITIWPLHGLEVCQLIGFRVSFLKNPVAASSQMLVNIVCNTFSGFAVAPMLMVALSGLGVMSTLPEQPANAARLPSPMKVQAAIKVSDSGDGNDSDDLFA